MKKRLILAILLLVIAPVLSFAAGTVTYTVDNPGPNVMAVTFSWTADASAGTVPDTAFAGGEGYCLYQAITNPGATAPTDNYDIVLNDADGVDMMGGTLANRDTANSELAVPALDSTNGVYGCRMVNGTMTMVLTNNSVNSATGTVKVFLKRP